MRTTSSLGLVAIMTGCGILTARPQPAATDALPQRERTSTDHAPPQPLPAYDAASFFETTSARGGGFNHDGSQLLVTSDATGVFNVISVATDGGSQRAMTHSTNDPRYGLSYFPADNRFLYSADIGGNERYQLFVMNLDGTSVDVMPGDETRAGYLGWNGDRSAFYITANLRDPQADDLYEVSLLEGYPQRLIFENLESWGVDAIGPAGRYIALARRNSNVDSDLFLWDRENPGEPVNLTAHEDDVSFSIQDFDPDGSGLWYTRDSDGEFRVAGRYDLETQQHEIEIEEAWDVLSVSHSETGRYRVHRVNADGRTVIRIVNTQTGAPVPMPAGLPKGQVTKLVFSRDETMVQAWVSSETAPSNLYVSALDGTFRRLTDTHNPAIDEAALVAAEVVRYPSFDGLEIPALLYRPKTATAGQPTPALVWVHGGPGGQHGTAYNPILQHLVHHGYAVLAVNNRGSDGYGRTFSHADDRRHGDVDLKDCIWGRRYLEGLAWVDTDRIGIMGASYGGYMVLTALALEPEAFDVGVDAFGFSNWVRTLESIPPWWESKRAAIYAEIGHPVEDRERLDAHSPLLRAAEISRPLMVVQGANDPRVLQRESDTIVDAVRENGVPVEYLVFEDEGHGFVKRENRIEASEAYLKFLDTHLAP